MQLMQAASSSRCDSSVLETSPKYMEDEASSQLENHCIVVPARNTLEHLGLNAKRMEKSLK